MKKISTIGMVLAALFLSLNGFSQSTSKKSKSASSSSSADIFSDKSVLLNVGVGLPWVTYSFTSGYYGYYATPTFSTALEFGVHKWISVGGFLKFDASGYTTNYFSNYKWTYTYLNFAGGAKGSFHFTAIGKEKWNWNINTSKLDLYASAFVGINYGVYSYSNDFDNKSTSNGGGVGPALGAAVGARYHFSPNIGVFAEVGPSPLGWVVAGLSAKLK